MRCAADHRTSLLYADDALRAIEAFDWPGNVRQLINLVKRAAIMAEGSVVTRADLSLPATAEGVDNPPVFDLRTVRDAAERSATVRALAHSDGNIVKAAELLGVSRPTLYDLMNRLTIRVDRSTRESDTP